MMQRKGAPFQHSSTFPWMHNNNSNKVVADHHDHEETASEMNHHQLAVDQIRHMNDLREEDCVHFDIAMKFADEKGIFDEQGSIDADRKHLLARRQQSAHQYHSLANPPGFSQHHHKIVIKNSVNRALYVIVALVLVFLVIELTVLRRKIFHNGSLALSSSSSLSPDANNNKKDQQQSARTSFSRIDFTGELMSVFWSALVCVSLCAMIQTFEVVVDSMTGEVTWTRYRSVIRVAKHRFAMTGVRQIVARIQFQSSSMKKKGGLADTNRIRYSIDMAVMREVMRDKSLAASSNNNNTVTPSTDFEFLQVDSVVGTEKARENVNLWVGFFQRIGVNCEVGPGDLPPDESENL